MKISTSKRINFYPQGQQFVARALCILWLLTSGSLERALASGSGDVASMQAAIQSAIRELDEAQSSGSNDFPKSYSLAGAQSSGLTLLGVQLSGLSDVPASKPSGLLPLVEPTKNDDVEQQGQLADYSTRALSHGFDLRLLIDGTPVEIGDLLQLKKIQRVLVTGVPGTGKTKLGEYLTEQWREQKWGQKFLCLYLLPVRSLQESEYDGTDYNSQETLATAIVNHCCTPPNQKEEYLQLREGIEEQLQHRTTLVILDGLDEREGASDKILQQAQEGAHKLLMLSRPYGVKAARQIADLEVEHMGFNEDHLRSSIWSRLEHELAKSFWTYIEDSESMQKIVKIPLHLELSCALWQDAGVRKALEKGSLSAFYRKLAQGIWDRYVAKSKLGDVPCDEPFNKLGEIALGGLNSDKEISAEQEKHFRDSGLLQYVEGRSDEPPFGYQFLNQTFQEYFAGRWLAVQFARNNKARRQFEEFMNHHKYNLVYGHTLAFLSGELSNQLVAQNKSISYRGSQLARLLSLMGSGPQEVVGLQQVLLQASMFLELRLATPEKHKHAVQAGCQVLQNLQTWLLKSIEISYLPQAQKTVEELMNDYWERQNATLIPYIVWKLHQTPLVIPPSQRRRSFQGKSNNDTKVTLYLAEGEKVWHGTELTDQFRALLDGELAKNCRTFYVAYGDAGKALSDYERALTMCEYFSFNRLIKAHAWSSLGDAWSEVGDALKAVNCYKRTLEILKKVHRNNPKYHPELIRVLCDLGNCHAVLKDERAVQYYNRAVTISKQICDQNFTPFTAAMIANNMGIAYFALNKPRNALIFFNRALEILREVHKDKLEHPEIAKTLNNLATSYVDLRELHTAVHFFNCALEIFTKVYEDEPEHPAIARTKKSLQVIHQNLQLKRRHSS